METITNQQMPTPTPKSKTWLWIVIIILVALLAGAGVYYWQNSKNKCLNEQTADEKVRNEMQVKITEAENKITELQNQLKDKVDLDSFSTWQTYTSNDYSYSFKYPRTYTIKEEENGRFTTLNNDNKGIIYFLPTGERDFGLPNEQPLIETINIDGLEATKTTYSNFFIVKLNSMPKNWNKENRIMSAPGANLEIVNKIFSTFKISQTGSSIFDPNTLKVGDKVANMTAEKIGPVSPSLPLDVTQNYKVTFKGQANISGKFYSNDILRDYCISVDQLDWAKLPQSSTDNRAPWFCITNPDVQAIKKIISENNGNTNITIDDYTIYQYPTEGSNQATLIKINN